MGANTLVQVTQIPRYHSSKSYTGCMRILVPTGLQEIGWIPFDNATPSSPSALPWLPFQPQQVSKYQLVTLTPSHPASFLVSISAHGFLKQCKWYSPKKPPNAPIPALAGKLPLPHKHSQLHLCPLPVVPVPAIIDAVEPAAVAAAAATLPKLMETVLMTGGSGSCATSASFLRLSGTALLANCYSILTLISSRA